jgi:hypothetical protein
MAIKPLVTSRTMWCCLMDSEWHFYHGLTSLPTNVDPGRGNTCALDYQSWQFIGLITTTVITFRPGMEYRAMGIFGIISESSWRMCMEMMRVDAPKHKYLFQGYILILKLLTSLWLYNTLYQALLHVESWWIEYYSLFRYYMGLSRNVPQPLRGPRLKGFLITQ